MEKTYLLTASAPQHISLAVDKLRNTIFNKTGAVSALVFEAAVPLAFFNKPVEKKLFSSILIQNEIFAITRVSEQQGVYFLNVEPSTIFQQIKEAGCGYTSPPLFEPASGFFMAAAEPSIDITALISLLETYQGLKLPQWKNLSLNLLCIEYSDKNLWWNEVDWSVLWELKLKRNSSI